MSDTPSQRTKPQRTKSHNVTHHVLDAEQLRDTLNAIHATPHVMTMNFAGAGAQALAWLHSVGGSSRTILEATDRYTPASLIEATGFTPERFTSVRVAKALANHAFNRAKQLMPSGKPLFGLGCTATIATDRSKRGDHRVAVATQNTLGVVTYELVIHKGARDRQGEEDLVSLIILTAVAEACGVFDVPALPLVDGEVLERKFEPVAVLRDLVAGERDWVTLLPTGELLTEPLEDITMLSGSFNPLHEGHRSLAQIAGETTGEQVYFELPLVNADKDPIDLTEAHRRAVQFLGIAPLILSRAPLFSEKAALFPSSTFVLGADTATRLVALRFYDNDEAKLRASLDAVKASDGRFLVAGRSSKGDFQTLEDINIPPAYRALFTEIPEEAFHMDISSTEIRKQLAK